MTETSRRRGSTLSTATAVATSVAKVGGMAGFTIFDPRALRAVRERLELAIQLRQAVDRGQLELRYQPIVDLATGALAGVEALVRWRHPDRGLVAPGRFIELAEEQGSIVAIGRWVLREACRQVAQWAADGSMLPGMYVAVNVSARELQESAFEDTVRQALAESGVPAAGLVLEISETALVRAMPSTIGMLQDLRALGVRVVIDDFGTGYCSLRHLRQLPIDRLKIDREFIQEGEFSSVTRTNALAGAMVAMAASLGIETVAEGIETEDEAEHVRSLGCTYGQGYYFARPLPSPDVPGAARETVVALAEEAALAEAEAEFEVVRERRRHLRRLRKLADARLAMGTIA